MFEDEGTGDKPKKKRRFGIRLPRGGDSDDGQAVLKSKLFSHIQDSLFGDITVSSNYEEEGAPAIALRSRASSVAAARMPVIILRGPLQFMCIL